MLMIAMAPTAPAPSLVSRAHEVDKLAGASPTEVDCGSMEHIVDLRPRAGGDFGTFWALRRGAGDSRPGREPRAAAPQSGFSPQNTATGLPLKSGICS